MLSRWMISNYKTGPTQRTSTPRCRNARSTPWNIIRRGDRIVCERLLARRGLVMAGTRYEQLARYSINNQLLGNVNQLMWNDVLSSSCRVSPQSYRVKSKRGREDKWSEHSKQFTVWLFYTVLYRITSLNIFTLLKCIPKNKPISVQNVFVLSWKHHQ